MNICKGNYFAFPKSYFYLFGLEVQPLITYKWKDENYKKKVKYTSFSSECK